MASLCHIPIASVTITWPAAAWVKKAMVLVQGGTEQGIAGFQHAMQKNSQFNELFIFGIVYLIFSGLG